MTFFSFNKIGENHKEKILVKKVTVVVALDLGTETNIETNEDLLAEVQRLRMENEYLKKLNALIQKRERSEKPTK